MKNLIRGLMILICTMFVEFAHAADTPEFTITTTPDTSYFEFYISAAGTFTIDWGDGTVETINKTNTTNTTYSHTYSSAGAYEIGISGDATAYNTSTRTAAISFYERFGGSQAKVTGISGSLGAIFGTLSDGTNPIFHETFRDCTSLTSIGSGLFAGITTGAYNMFNMTFYNCTGLTELPPGLFSGITTGAMYMFSSTFAACKSLTSIPDDLFASINGPGARGMFITTFNSCASLKSIPAVLFAGITTAGIETFMATFEGCVSLTSIPVNLFASITMLNDWAFLGTFDNCDSLTGYVNGNMFTIPAEYGSYEATFNGADNMLKTCPKNTYAVPKPDPNWTVAVCLPCPPGTVSPADSQSIDACVPERCAISLRTRTGVTIPTYPTKRTTPAIAVSYGDDMCYIDVEKNKRGKYIIRAESR